MNTSPLFRKAALAAHRDNMVGEIVLIRPPSFTFLTATAVGMGLLIVGFMLTGSYTKRYTISGRLAPNMGVLKIYVPQFGTVVEKRVLEGQSVKRGDLLFLISSERLSSTEVGIQRTISRQVKFRAQSLRNELSQTRRLHRDEENALRKKISGLEAEHTSVLQQLRDQRARIALADMAANRASQLLALGYFSAEMAQQKQADLLDQRTRLRALEREQIGVAQQLHDQMHELTSLPLRQRNHLAQIERILTSTNQELLESEAKRRIAIVAPERGIATAVTAEVGQSVDGARPLVTIIPSGALLQAHLYAPSRSIGFIRPQDRVLLRYQAFPYQKFGHARGSVASVSRTALMASEIADGPVAATGNAEPLYRIIVTLESQSIVAYGNSLPLQAGMLVDGDILREKRKLYEWVLEPLYTLTGKF